MEKIKIVQIIADSKVGGGSNHVIQILKNLDKNKFDIYLVCPRGYLLFEAEKLGVNVKVLKFQSKFDLETILKLKKTFEEIQSSGNPFAKMIVHSHGPRAGFFTSLVAPHASVKIYTEHLYTSEYQLKNSFNGFLQSQMISYVYRQSDTVVAVSSAVKKYLLNRGVTESKIALIPNGINIKAEHVGVKRSTYRIGTIGNLVLQKGQKYLIQALSKIVEKYPDTTLEIVGEGPLKESLQREIDGLNLSKKVILSGEKKNLSSWDIFVLPSISESFGIVILEAMNEGVPVVATCVGGTSDIIKSGENGLLVPSRDKDKLASAVIKLFRDRELGQDLVVNAYKTLKNFDWSQIIKKIEKLYLTVE